jgi:acyl-CoA thioesterase YciA
MDDTAKQPTGELIFQAVAMPGEGNHNRGVFGGWILSQMDLAGGMFARNTVKSRVSTIAIDSLRFHKPMLLGDVACCYGSIVTIGTTSITVKIELWAIRMNGWGTVVEPNPLVKICEGLFTFVALDENFQPQAIPVERRPSSP